MQGKICLITGATSGIGKIIATELAKKGAQIGIIARNVKKAERTKESIITKTGNHHIKIFIADFASLDQVKKVAKEINAQFNHIDVLVNNAGVILSDKRALTKEGYELTLNTNHLSPFLLTTLIFDKLKESKEARIINTSSLSHSFARVDFEDIHLKNKYSSIKAYSNSKLYNLMFTIELAKRLKHYQNITTYAYHPGIVSSKFSEGSGGIVGFFYKIAAPFLATNEKGAETGIFLASSPAALKYHGKYMVKKRPASPVKRYLSKENCKRLWKISEDLTGVKFL